MISRLEITHKRTYKTLLNYYAASDENLSYEIHGKYHTNNCKKI